MLIVLILSNRLSKDNLSDFKKILKLLNYLNHFFVLFI